MSHKNAFILKSEVTSLGPTDAARRSTLVSELSKEDIDRVSGGTDSHPDISPDWDPNSGGDSTTSADFGERVFIAR